MMHPFWFKGVPNYGDILTPWMLDKIGVPYQFTNRDQCDSLLIGSIARLARPGVNVYGSGFIRKSDEACAAANWHWVRGPISRQMVLDAGGKCPDKYGDLALALPLLQPRSPVRHEIGYTPHGVDYDLLPPELNRIKMYWADVEETTRRITECERIVSSSLHGIIVAMAYGIPAAWVPLSDRLSGDGMKFYDFYRSVGLEPVVSTLDAPVFQLPERELDVGWMLEAIHLRGINISDPS